jgi:hypothetical protein
MSKLLDWQRFAGPFGKRVIKQALIFFPKNPIDLIYHSVAFMKYWAGSHVTAEASQLRQELTLYSILLLELLTREHVPLVQAIYLGWWLDLMVIWRLMQKNLKTLITLESKQDRCPSDSGPHFADDV